MMCDEAQNQLDAFIDGTLDTARCETVQSHLAECASCQAEVQQRRSIEDQLRTAFQDELVSATLWPRIQADIERIASAEPIKPVRRPRTAWVWPSVAAAIVVLALGIMMLRPLLSPVSVQAQLLSIPVQDMHTFVVSQRALDVSSPRSQYVRQWFQEKVDFALPLLPVRAGSAQLVGGRLCHFLNRRVAAYMYDANGHYLSLYIMSRQGLEPPPGKPLELEPVQATVHEVQGYTHILWSQTDLLYALVADLPQDQLVDMAKTLAPAGKNRL